MIHDDVRKLSIEKNISTLNQIEKNQKNVPHLQQQEGAFVGPESEHNLAEPEALCCDNGATTSWSSSFLNCTEITERAVAIDTAQDGTVMMTTHVCLKTLCEGSDWWIKTYYDQNIYCQQTQA